MKTILITITLLGALAARGVVQETHVDTKALEKKDEEDLRIRAQFGYSFNNVRDKLVVIKHEQGSGSGFIATMDGKTYLFTNQHVILGAEKISFTTVSGEKIRPRKVELAATRDIARLLLNTDSGFIIADQIEMDIPIGVFGNSEGAGVATELYGMITGVGGELVEVSADFVPSNSGSPVLNLDQEVVGIASYATYSRKNRATEGTQFENKTRRFCYRLTDVQWKSVNWKKYNDNYGKMFMKSETLIDGVHEIISIINDDSLDMIRMSDHSERSLNVWESSHNQIISKYNRGEYHHRDLSTAYSDSMRAVSGICRGRGRQLLMLSKKRDLSGFLKQRFEQQAYTLENLAKEFNHYSDSIHL